MRPFFDILVITVKGSTRSPSNLYHLKDAGAQPISIESLSTEHNSDELTSLHRGRGLYYLTVGRDLSLGEIGCAYGHQLAYKSLVSSSRDWALVLEDDAHMDSPIDSLFEEIHKLKNPAVISLIDRRGGIQKPFQKKDSELIKLLLPSQATSAYLINRNAATIFLSNYRNYGVLSPSDWPYPQSRKISFYITRQPFFIHNWTEEGSLLANGRNFAVSDRFYEPELVNHFSIRKALVKVLALHEFGINFTKLWYAEFELKIKSLFLIRLSSFKDRFK
jgi:GR25 family glycosyltransferase involved in LPS biosynthesis